MANILFASNNPTDFGSSAGTTTLRADLTRTPYSVTSASVCSSPIWPVTANRTTWIHLRAWGSAGASGSASGDAWQVYAENGQLLFNLFKRTNTPTSDCVFYNANGTSFTVASAGSVNTAGDWDLKCVTTASSIELEFYQLGALIASHTFASNPNNVFGPVQFSFRERFFQSGVSEWNEVIVADSNTLGARLSQRRPNVAGTYTDFDGNLADIADANALTSMSTRTALSKHTFQPEAYSLGATVSNVVLATRQRRGTSAPTGLKHTLRAGTTDYDEATVFSVGEEITIAITDWELDPSTSLPWVATDVDQRQYGFISQA